MIQADVSEKHNLHELGYKIFLDRYAQKDMSRTTLAVGDTVIVLMDSQVEQREIGEIVAMDLPNVTVRLSNDETVVRPVEHVDKPLETNPAQMMDRVAAGVAASEKTSALRQEWTEKFRWALDDWKFVPGGRILVGAGTDQDLTFFNCYVLPCARDSRDGIIERLGQMTEIMSRGGGVGINISSLRPRHSYVKGVNGRSSGAVSWGALYSFATGLIEQGGSRRGALMLILNDWHPDILEFIKSKRTAGYITNANISVGLSDRFMEAVKNDDDWDLVFPDTSDAVYNKVWDGDLEGWVESGHKVIHHKTIKARELWNAVIESAWASAEPGLWFRERANKMSNSHYYSPLISTNPCGEVPLPAFSVCNLGSVNLSKFYDSKNHDVAWDKLEQTVRYAVRFLDNIIDITPYFFDENKRVQRDERRVGMGTMGIAELMVRLGIRYGSDESVVFIDKLCEFIATNAYQASIELAEEKGAFPQFDAEQFLQSGFMQNMPEVVRDGVKAHGIRNVTLLTQAPTGTTGTMVNTSTGIEPFFSWSYYRKGRLGLHEERVEVVREWFEAHPDEKELPDYFVTAMELSPEDHVRVQAAIQRWVDSSISKTCNVPNDYTVDQTRELYEYMYELGCKGGTIYRDGSRDEQVLTPKDEQQPEAVVKQVATPHHVYPRPPKLQGVTVKCATPFGKAYISMNSDDNGYPFEVFITAPGKAGSDLQADAEGLGRMISLALRSTEPHNRLKMVKLVIEQLRGIGGARSVGFGQNRVTSLPDSVSQALEDNYFPKEEAKQLGLPMVSATNGSNPKPSLDIHDGMITGADMCPSCAMISLIRTEGCRKCLSCGYSEC